MVGSGTEDTLVGDEPKAPPVVRRAVGPGDEVGRYVVLSRLGAGAMGIVLAAYDPELDRKVALKLLKVRRRGTDEETARARLQREAQALARLNHTNVVTVHDVGVHEGQVFIAMEFVDGQTLTDWLGGEEAGGVHRPWREVVEVFQEAGAGLAAAHAEGLVHRDFKPDNVMIGVDRRVRVMDFGLARADEAISASVPDDAEISTSASMSLSARITRTGAFMGTPAYMAPEQFSGSQVGPASDQFSFCVALHEALFGQRPFAGETVAQIAFAVSHGKIVEPARGRRVPGWLRSTLRRGLEAEPSQRFASMDALLASLRHGEVRRRRFVVLGIAAGLALLGVGAGIASDIERRRTAAACEAQGDSLAQVWNDEAASRLRASSVASGLSYGPTTIERAIPYLDAQRDALRATGTRVCLAHRVERRWDEELFDRARGCLEERRLELEAVVGELTGGDPTSIRRAVSVAARLEPVESCLDEGALRRSSPIQGAAEGERATLALLSRVRALDGAGKYAESLLVAREALARTETLDSPVLRARARIHVGEAEQEVGDYATAEATLQQAYFEALGVQAWAEAATAATALTFLVGSALARPEEGVLWARHATVALDALDEPEDGTRRVRLDDNLASVHFAAGRLEEAKALYGRVIETRERQLGPNHPVLTPSLNNLAVAHAREGSLEAAEELFLRSLELRRSTLGPEHPSVATALRNLANIGLAREDYAEVVRLLREVLAIEQAVLTEDHPDLAMTLANLASALGELGEYEEAIPLARRALSIRRLRLAPDHPELASSLDALGNLERETKQWDEARAHHTEALRIREGALDPDNPDLAFSLHGVASVAEHDGDFALAIRSAERALELREEEGTRPYLEASSRFLLARALWAAAAEEGRDRARARTLAEQADRALREIAPESAAAHSAGVWLEAHPAPD